MIEQTPHSSEGLPASEDNDVYLLGGSDLEMYQIRKRLERRGKEYIDKRLQWGATVADYEKEIAELLDEGKTPVAVELAGAEEVPGVVDIDHHGDKFHHPASITRVMERSGDHMRLMDKLIAANDSAYIPGLEKELEDMRGELEARYGEEGYQKKKRMLIDLIRRSDRKMQGVTEEQELAAPEQIAQKEVTESGTVVVRTPYDTFSPIADRLYDSWPEGRQNLVVVCGFDTDEQVVYYFGRGDVCRMLEDEFSGFGGGVGYGDPEGLGFGGCSTSDPESVIARITEKYLEVKDENYEENN
jgi:hypothetical protein